MAVTIFRKASKVKQLQPLLKLFFKLFLCLFSQVFAHTPKSRYSSTVFGAPALKPALNGKRKGMIHFSLIRAAPATVSKRKSLHFCHWA
jgi:hypothetical protein